MNHARHAAEFMTFSNSLVSTVALSLLTKSLIILEHSCSNFEKQNYLQNTANQQYCQHNGLRHIHVPYNDFNNSHEIIVLIVRQNTFYLEHICSRIIRL